MYVFFNCTLHITQSMEMLTLYISIHTYVDYHNKDKPSHSDVARLDDISCGSHNQDWLDGTRCQHALGAVHDSNNRRNLSLSIAKSRMHISGNTNYVYIHNHVLT